MLIRPALPGDAPAIAAIYAHYVRHTAVTFACREPSAAHYARQIAEGMYPFLAAVDEDGSVAGFAYASAFREKEAFRWGAELTIYLRPGLERCGTGSRLMAGLLAILRRQGYLLAYSCVTLPNEGSLALHRRFGFEQLGVFPRTGYKLGRWHDVIWLHLPLGGMPEHPDEPLPFSALTGEETARLLR